MMIIVFVNQLRKVGTYFFWSASSDLKKPKSFFYALLSQYQQIEKNLI